MYLASLEAKTLIPKYVKVFGTRYEAGQVLVLKKLSHGLLKIGLIKHISFNGTSVKFCVRTFKASQSKYGFYVTTKFLSQFEVTELDDLADYYPLEMVGTADSFSFILHHFISTTSSDDEEEQEWSS